MDLHAYQLLLCFEYFKKHKTVKTDLVSKNPVSLAKIWFEICNETLYKSYCKKKFHLGLLLINSKLMHLL